MIISQFTIRTSVVLLFGAILFYSIAKWQGVSQHEDGRSIKEARQALSTGKAYRARQDSTQRKVSAAVITVRLRDTVIVRLDAQLTQDASARDSVETLLLVRDTLIAQRDSLFSAVRLLSLRVNIAEERNTILQANLVAVLAVAECHVMGVRFLPKCPSRTASFLLGSGVVGGLALLKH